MPLLAPCLSIVLLLGMGPPESGSRVVGASSSLAQKARVLECSGSKPHWRAATFGPASAMDGSEETAWCEGAPGPGIGEWLEVEVNHSIEQVWVKGGFRKSLTGAKDCVDDGDQEGARNENALESYRSNGRPSVLELTTVEGKVIERFQIADVMTNDYFFDVRLEPGKYRLRIAKAYPGTRYEDTCITEVRFEAPRKSEPVPEVYGALLPFTKRWSCRADQKTTTLPQEVRFLGMTGTISARDLARKRGAVRIEVAAFTPEGVMLPAISAECFWGGLINGIECGAEGNATKEGEGSVLDDPAWSIKLTAHEPNDVAAPWTGEFALGHYVQGADAGDLQLNLTIGHGAGPGPVDLSVTRAGAVVEKARYTCTQLP